MRLLVLTIIWCLPAAFNCGPIATQTDNDTKLEWQRSVRQADLVLTGIEDLVQELVVKPIEKAEEFLGQIQGTTNGLASEPAVKENDETTEVPKPPLVKPADGTASLVNSTTGGDHQLSTRAANLTDVAKQHVDSAISQLVDGPKQLLAKTASLVSNPSDGANQLLARASILSDGLFRQAKQHMDNAIGLFGNTNGGIGDLLGGMTGGGPQRLTRASSLADETKQHVDSAASVIGQLVEKTTDLPNQLLVKTASLVSNPTDGATQLLARASILSDGLFGQAKQHMDNAIGLFGNNNGGIGDLLGGVTGGSLQRLTRASSLADETKQHVDSAPSVIGQLVEKTTDLPNQLLEKIASLVSNPTDGANQLLARQSSFPGGDLFTQALGFLTGEAPAGQQVGSTDGGFGSLLSGVTGGSHGLSIRAANMTEALVNTTAEETNGLMARSAGDLTSNAMKFPGQLIKQVIKLVRLATAGNPILKNIVDSLVSSWENKIPQIPNQESQPENKVVKKVEEETVELDRNEEDTKEGNKSDIDEAKESSKNKEEDKEEDDVEPEKQKGNKGNNKQKKKKAKTANKLKKTGTKSVKKGDKKKKTNLKERKTTKNNNKKAEEKDDEDKNKDDDDKNDEDAEDEENEDGEEDNEDEDAEEEEDE